MGVMQIGKWGNSLAVRLPKELVDRYKLKEGDEIGTAGIEQELAAAELEERQRRRQAALERIRQNPLTLPLDWKFDREEANWRPAMDRW